MSDFDPAMADPLTVIQLRNDAVRRLSDELVANSTGFFALVCRDGWLDAKHYRAGRGPDTESPRLTSNAVKLFLDAQHWLELATRLLNVGSRLGGTAKLVVEFALVPGECFDTCLVRTGPRSYSRVFYLDKVGRSRPPQAIPLDDELSLYYHAWVTSGCRAALVSTLSVQAETIARERARVFLTNRHSQDAKKKYTIAKIFGPRARAKMTTSKVRSLTEVFLNGVADGSPAAVQDIAFAHRHSGETADKFYNNWRNLSDARGALTTAGPYPDVGAADDDDDSSDDADADPVHHDHNHDPRVATLPTVADVFARTGQENEDVPADGLELFLRNLWARRSHLDRLVYAWETPQQHGYEAQIKDANFAKEWKDIVSPGYGEYSYI